LTLNRHQALNEILSHRAYERGDGVAVHFPRDIYLQVASACNLDCFMCSEHNRPRPQRRGHGLTSLSPELFEVVEREIFPYSRELMLGVGGEPMLSKHFLEYVERAHAMNQEVRVLTNGTRIRTEAAAATLSGCVSQLQVSIDAATAETYETIRSGSRWKSLRANLDRLNRIRLAAPPGRRCFLQLNFVLMQCNIRELPAFVDFAREVEADRVYGQHLIIVTEAARGESLYDDPDLYNRIHEEAMARAREGGMDLDLPDPYPVGIPTGKIQGPADEEVLIPFPLPTSDWTSPADLGLKASSTAFDAGDAAVPSKRIPCHMPTNSVLILYDGRVFPCCHPYAHKQMEMGNLNSQTFKEIWNSRHYRNLRVGLFTGDAPHICRSCSLVHDPPPEREDPERLDREENCLQAHYGDQDLAPMKDPAGECIDVLSGSSLLETSSAFQATFDAFYETLESLRKERDTMVDHIRNLEKDSDGMDLHLRNLEKDRDGMDLHIRNLEQEMASLEAHVRGLEGEMSVREAHIRDLEKGLRRFRNFPLIRAARGVRGLFVNRD